MQTSVFQNGIIMVDSKAKVAIYERGPYGYDCETVVSQS